MCSCLNEEGRPRCLMTHFCCCSLKTLVYCIAVSEMVLFAGLMTALVYFMATTRGHIGEGRFSVPSIFFLYSVHFVMDCALLHGVRKRRRDILWGLVWARGVQMVGYVQRNVIWMAVMFYFKSNYGGLGIGLGIVVMITSNVFCIVAIRSYALQLKAMDTLSSSPLQYTCEGRQGHDRVVA